MREAQSGLTGNILETLASMAEFKAVMHECSHKKKGLENINENLVHTVVIHHAIYMCAMYYLRVSDFLLCSSLCYDHFRSQFSVHMETNLAS